MPPAIQDNSGDVAPRVETPAREHRTELLSDLSFVVSKDVPNISARPRCPLVFGGSPGYEYKTFKLSTIGESGLIVDLQRP